MAFRAPSYTCYEGPRLKRPAWMPLVAATLKRGWRSVWVKRVVAASGAAALGMIVFFYVLNKLIPDWRNLTERAGEAMGADGSQFRVDARLYRNFLYVFVYPVLMPLSLLFGSDIVAADIRSNALESYFSRPITPIGYVLGRTLAFAGFLLLATLAPMLAVWTVDVTTAPASHFGLVRGVPLGLALTLVPTALTLSLMVQAAATLTRSAMGANIFLAVFFVFFHALAWSLYDSTDRAAWLALSFFSVVQSVCSASLGVPVSPRDDAPPAALAFAVLIGLAAVSFAVLWSRLKRRVLVG